MKILITGCHGQVGTELMFLAEAYGCKALGVDRDTLDITDQSAVNQAMQDYKPEAVINAAAYTAVDKAEGDAQAALAVNATAVAYLAEACAKAAIPLVHISTDYVFDGNKEGAYLEADPVNPLGVYGETKLAGEDAVKSFCEQYYILRTSWVFSAHGNNFVKTMLSLGAEREELGIVADQYGKPTSAREIARTIYMMLAHDKQAWGSYHIAQPESTTWFDFAKAIFSAADKQGLKMKVSTLKAIKTEDYPTPAKRPKNSALDCTKLEQTFELKIQPWAISLSDVMKDLKNA